MRTSLAHRAWCAELMTKSPSLKVVNIHLKCPPPYTLNSMWQAPLYPLILYEFSGCFSAFVILLAALCKGKTLRIHHIFWDLNILLENVFLFFGFFLSSLLCLYYLVVCEIYMVGVYILWFIAPKASAEGACILSKWVTVVGYCDDDDGPNRVKRTLISLKVMLSSCNAVCLYTCICIQKPLFAHKAA